jgi:hypothetical protein
MIVVKLYGSGGSGPGPGSATLNKTPSGEFFFGAEPDLNVSYFRDVIT